MSLEKLEKLTVDTMISLTPAERKKFIICLNEIIDAVNEYNEKEEKRGKINACRKRRKRR